MDHSFSVEIATDLKNVNLAILIKNFDYWLSKNKANNKHFHDGTFWTYNSVEAFVKLFPYFTKNQIRRLLEKLIDLNVLRTGNHNINKYDRTIWYTFTNAFVEKYKSICQFCQMEMSDQPNGNVEIATPIPDIKPVVKTNKEGDIKKELPQIFDLDFFKENIKVEYPKYLKFDLDYYFDRAKNYLNTHKKTVENFTAYTVSFMQGDEKNGKPVLNNNKPKTGLKFDPTKPLETRQKQFLDHLNQNYKRYRPDELKSFYIAYSKADNSGIMLVEKSKYKIQLLLDSYLLQLKKTG